MATSHVNASRQTVNFLHEAPPQWSSREPPAGAAPASSDYNPALQASIYRSTPLSGPPSQGPQDFYPARQPAPYTTSTAAADGSGHNAQPRSAYSQATGPGTAYYGPSASIDSAPYSSGYTRTYPAGPNSPGAEVWARDADSLGAVEEPWADLAKRLPGYLASMNLQTAGPGARESWTRSSIQELHSTGQGRGPASPGQGTYGSPLAKAPANAKGNTHGADVPFGTERTVKDLLERSQHLEDHLVALCQEKSQLEAEYAKMPVGGGRSVKERNRKAVVEQRLESLAKDISNTRLQLKKLQGK